MKKQSASPRCDLWIHICNRRSELQSSFGEREIFIVKGEERNAYDKSAVVLDKTKPYGRIIQERRVCWNETPVELKRKTAQRLNRLWPELAAFICVTISQYCNDRSVSRAKQILAVFSFSAAVKWRSWKYYTALHFPSSLANCLLIQSLCGSRCGRYNLLGSLIAFQIGCTACLILRHYPQYTQHWAAGEKCWHLFIYCYCYFRWCSHLFFPIWFQTHVKNAIFISLTFPQTRCYHHE